MASLSRTALVASLLVAATASGQDRPSDRSGLPATEPTVLWQVPSEPAKRSMTDPTYSDGVVFVGDSAAGLYAIDAETGAVIWRTPIIEVAIGNLIAVKERPSVDEARVYVSSGQGVLAYDRFSGERLWFYDIDTGAGENAPQLIGDLVVVAGYDGAVHALDRTTGEAAWTRDILADAPPDPKGFSGKRARFGGIKARPAQASTDGRWYFLSVFDQSRVLAIDAESPDGRIVWSYQTGGWTRPAPLVAGDAVYVVSQGKRIAKLDRETGAEQWRHEVDTWNVSRPGLYDGMVYVPIGGGRLLVLDTDMGQRLHTFKAIASEGSIYTDPLINDDLVIFPLSRLGRLVALDRKTGAMRWDVEPGDFSEMYSDLATDGQRIFLTTRLGDGGGLHSVLAVGLAE